MSSFGTGQDLERSAPTVSVIIPTHNRAGMLGRAIQSVLAQTWQDFEIIVVSDGSKDNTEEVVDSFNDPRIRLLKHKTVQGAAAARNTGLRVAGGNFIAFLDDDDEWTPRKLQIQLPIIKNSRPEVGLVYAWMEYLRNGQVVDVRKPELRGYVFPEMLDKQPLGGCPTIMIKRKVLDVVKGFDERLPRGNDGDFIRRITKHFEVDYVPEVLCKVHVEHVGRVSTDSKGNLENVVWALEKRLEDFQEEFEMYPIQKANVFAHAGVTSFKTGQYRKGLAYYWNLIHCEVGWKRKARLLFQAIKAFIKHLVGKILSFRQPTTQ